MVTIILHSTEPDNKIRNEMLSLAPCDDIQRSWCATRAAVREQTRKLLETATASCHNGATVTFSDHGFRGSKIVPVSNRILSEPCSVRQHRSCCQAPYTSMPSRLETVFIMALVTWTTWGEGGRGMAISRTRFKVWAFDWKRL
jgi:hypothetical protein